MVGSPVIQRSNDDDDDIHNMPMSTKTSLNMHNNAYFSEYPTCIPIISWGLISYGASCGPFLFPFFGTLGILCYIDVQSGGKVIFRLSSKVPITKSLLSTITKSIMT